jgi:hypothetical protein
MAKFFFSIISILIVFSGCINFAGDCEKTIVKQALTPDGKLQAVRVRIDCGATTTPSSSIRIVENGDSTDMGDPKNTIVSEAAGTDFYWQNNDSLFIKGADTANGNFMKDSFFLSKTNRKITIVYSKP